MKHIYTSLILLIALFIGCADVEQNNNDEYDKAELLRVLDEDDALGLNGFDDGGLIDFSESNPFGSF